MVGREALPELIAAQQIKELNLRAARLSGFVMTVSAICSSISTKRFPAAAARALTGC
jgi:hypothetical protein